MAGSQSPGDILRLALEQAQAERNATFIDDPAIAAHIENVATSSQNRALVRLLLACSLAVVHHPTYDIRKPYTEIGDPDAFSGRTYDERYITEFIQTNRLPCNTTTAFLTPALRNRNTVITPEMDLVGRPPQLYRETQQLLDDVHRGRLSAWDLLVETIRLLLILRDEQEQRMGLLMKSILTVRDQSVLSAEAIITLIEQHLRLHGSSRLPVLIVAAAYAAAAEFLREEARPLSAHNAADRQTGSLGDLEITLSGDDHVRTSYEMKTRAVTISDIDVAVAKVAQSQSAIDNYIFVTTERIDPDVQDHALSLYATTGIEFVVLDCIGFLRHFLHLFHRLRHRFLEEYQTLVLAEPDSAVSRPLKEAFLAMRLTAENTE